MKPDELRNAYITFFVKSEAGKNYVTELQRLIASDHNTAENKPESARDHTQRAKGTRQALDHIASVLSEVKKK